MHASTNLSQPRVLVADDQDDVLVALDLLLKNEGFTPDFAHTPADVVAALGRRQYDLLLLDMNYARDTTSGTEGLELLSAIRERDSALPVVLMTAWGTVELAVDAMRRGGHDFIQKPWDNRKLLETLRRNLEQKTAPGVPGDDGAHLREVEEACEVQRRLLPTDLPQPDGYRIHGSWQPAGGVGGDYFDAIELAGSRLAVLIADVSGKGLPAALLMANVQAAVRAVARATESPAEICRRLNGIILENTPTEKFVTFFFGILDTHTRRLRYANAGHLPPAVISADGSITRLVDGGSVLGVFADARFEESETVLRPGARAVLFTDGVTEAQNGEAEEFGDRRLMDLLADYRDRSDIDVHRAALDAVRAFAGELQDDATILTLTVDRFVG